MVESRILKSKRIRSPYLLEYRRTNKQWFKTSLNNTHYEVAPQRLHKPSYSRIITKQIPALPLGGIPGKLSSQWRKFEEVHMSRQWIKSTLLIQINQSRIPSTNKTIFHINGKKLKSPNHLHISPPRLPLHLTRSFDRALVCKRILGINININ